MIGKMKSNRRNRELRNMIEERVRYATEMRRMEAGERSIHKLAEEHRQQAAAAEARGDHAAAVRLAHGYQRLEKQGKTTGDMKNTVMTAHAIAESTKALTKLMAGTSGLAGSAVIADPVEMYRAQIELEAVRDSIDMALEQTEEVLDAVSDPDETCSEAGEEALKAIMKTAAREKNNNVLRETGKKLDALQRTRTLD